MLIQESMKNGFRFEDDRAILDLKRGIDRNMLIALRTTNVNAEDHEAVISGCERIITEVKRNIKVINVDNTPILDAGIEISADSIQEGSLLEKDIGFGTQLSGNMIFDKLENLGQDKEKTRKNLPYSLITLDKDFTCDDEAIASFTYGYGKCPVMMVSTKRIGTIYSKPKERRLALEIVSAHETGHILDLVLRDFNSEEFDFGRTKFTQEEINEIKRLYSERDLPLKDGHCAGEAGPCIMEKVNIPGRKTLEELMELIKNRSSWLCSDCMAEISYKSNFLIKRGYNW